MAKIIAYTKKRKYSTRKAVTVSIPKLRRIMQQVPELKFYEATLANTPTSTWAFSSFLTGIQQGTALGTIPLANNRIGNKIFVKYIELMVGFTPTVTAGQTSGGVCRCVVYHNNAAAGLSIAGADVFSPNTYAGLRYTPGTSRISLKRDRTHVFVPVATNAANVSAAAPIVLYKMRIRINKEIAYVSNNGTASDLIKDDYGFGCCANNGTTCTMSVNYKVVFTDS